MGAGTTTPSVLIIDNNPERATALVQILEASRYNVAVPFAATGKFGSPSFTHQARHHIDRCRFSGTRDPRVGCDTACGISVSDGHVFAR